MEKTDNILEESKYRFKTTYGEIWMKPSDILEALSEQANNISENCEVMDVTGWSLAYGTDENGHSHPMFLIRSVPADYRQIKSTDRMRDDVIINSIVEEKIYGLNWFKRLLLRIKSFLKNYTRKKHEIRRCRNGMRR